MDSIGNALACVLRVRKKTNGTNMNDPVCNYFEITMFFFQYLSEKLSEVYFSHTWRSSVQDVGVFYSTIHSCVKFWIIRGIPNILPCRKKRRVGLCPILYDEMWTFRIIYEFPFFDFNKKFYPKFNPNFLKNLWKGFHSSFRLSIF